MIRVSFLVVGIILLNSFSALAQKDVLVKKSGAEFYGSLFGTLEVKASTLGAGIGLGYKLNPILGFGGGADAMQMKGINNKTLLATSVFGELRLFAKQNKITPSIAFQYGKFNYNDNLNISSGYIISQSTISGKDLIGVNLNFCFKSRNNNNGFSIGYSFRSVNIESNNNTIVINSPNPSTKYSSITKVSTNFNLITFGYNF